MSKRCPIQIIEEGYAGRVTPLWVALLKDIDFEHKRYENITRFGYDKWIVKLFKWHMKAEMASYDIIRNPTLEEWKVIQKALIDNNLRFNLKTSEFIELNKQKKCCYNCKHNYNSSTRKP